MAITQDVLYRILDTSKGREFTIATALPKRQKNIDTFVHLNYVPPYIEEVGEILDTLVLDDYVKGPEPDDAGFPGEVYVLKKNVFSHQLYIKIRIYEEDGNIGMTVISFHI